MRKTALMAIMAITTLTTASFTACEKAIIEEENEQTETTTSSKGNKEGKQQTGNVVIRVSDFNLIPITQTKAVTDLTTYCTRLNYVVYKDGKKVDSRSQLKEDGGFGEVSMSLSPGTYKLLVLAHSSSGGNPVLSDPEKIQFTNALGYTDTFYFYGDIEVTSESKTHDITLTRATSLLNFIISDDIPAEVTHMHFLYTGGSGVLNAITGYGGNVNSKQERLYNIVGLSAPLKLPIYTFLQTDEGQLEVTVTARDAKGNDLLVRKFSNIPMKRDAVTQYTGIFFNHDSDNGFSLRGETDWSDTIKISY